MAIQIGAKPDSGFDDPIGMLKDCHRRIEQFLHVLVVVCERAQRRALTDEEAKAVDSALQYFETGGKRHTMDEEESLFPRMRTSPATDSLNDLGRLEADHRTAEELHGKVETLYAAWMAGGGLSAPAEQELARATQRLAHLYKEHIEVEEGVIFPEAAESLSPAMLAEIGKEFRTRRS